MTDRSCRAQLRTYGPRSGPNNHVDKGHHWHRAPTTSLADWRRSHLQVGAHQLVVRRSLLLQMCRATCLRATTSWYPMAPPHLGPASSTLHASRLSAMPPTLHASRLSAKPPPAKAKLCLAATSGHGRRGRGWGNDVSEG
jgi:hypothetical protein